MKNGIIITAALVIAIATWAAASHAATNDKNNENMETLNLTREWDKTFPLSDKVNHDKVTFTNRFGITLAADIYTPKNAEGRLPAIAVGGPFGAVKEQASGLYAQELAERGFITIAFDPSYTGESGGTPRYVASPDINTEDFCAAVDFLSLRDDVDPERIGILGICGWGGMALNAAAIDTRMFAMTDLNSLSEAIELAEVTGCRMIVSHFEYQYGVGVEYKALEMLDSIDFPPELIVNSTFERFEAYIAEREARMKTASVL